MVLKRSIKKQNKRRRRRRSRNIQKGAGYSFKLDCNLPGGEAEVVTYKNCGPSQAELGPPENSQLAPPGQASVEVVGVSNENLAPIQAEQQAAEVVQQKQTGGKRRRRKSRKSRKTKRTLRNKRRISKRRRRRRRQKGGDFNCPNCDMSLKEFGCKQPLWNSKCI